MDKEPRPSERQTAAYDLADVRAAVSEGRYRLARRVRRHTRRQGWNREVVEACLRELDPGDLHKSQRHLERPGVWLDIYRPRFRGDRMYVKLVLDSPADGFVVLSFCRDGEKH